MGWPVRPASCPIVERMRDHAKSVRLRLGRNVQQFRRLRGFSQEHLAERAFTSLKGIGRIERGEVNVTIDVLTRIAASLGVDVCDLLESDADRSAFVLVPAQHLEALDELLKALEHARATRSRPQRTRSR